MARIHTQQTIDIVRLRYPNEPTHEIATDLGLKLQQVYAIASSYGFSKSQEFLQSDKSGRLRPGTNQGGNTRFEKGHIPLNKGVTMSKETRLKLEPTFFTKGHSPKNELYDGAIRVRGRKDGSEKYKYIRVSKAKWELLHRKVWQDANGPIPKGYRITFIDQDSLNCSLENLRLISPQEAMDSNRITKHPLELQEVIKLNNKILKKIQHGKK